MLVSNGFTTSPQPYDHLCWSLIVSQLTRVPWLLSSELTVVTKMVQVGEDYFDHRHYFIFWCLLEALWRKKKAKHFDLPRRLCYSKKRIESICCCVAKDQHCSLSEAAHIGSFGTDFPSSVFNEIGAFFGFIAFFESCHFYRIRVWSESGLVANSHGNPVMSLRVDWCDSGW